MPDVTILARFGTAVRTLRSGLGISQEALAERADLHRTYIADIERGGRNITLKNMEKLARALEVSTAHLLARSDDTAAHQGKQTSGFQSGNFAEILLIEDNTDDVKLTLAAFQQVRLANRIQVISDGATALDYLLCTGAYANRSTRKPPQVILLDLDLPKVSGLEVLRRLKRDPHTRTIAVVVLTVSQNSENILESRRLGAETYIVKPVDFYNFSQVTPQLQFQWGLLQASPAVRA